jgi:hypothetical protein
MDMRQGLEKRFGIRDAEVASVGITAGEHISLGIIATVKSLTSRL